MSCSFSLSAKPLSWGCPREGAKACKSTSRIQKFTPPQQELLFGKIDKHVSRRWADSVPQGTHDAREVVPKNTASEVVIEGEAVNDCTGTNMRSPPGTNSQLSMVETARLVRRNLQKWMVMHQPIHGPGLYANQRQN